MLQYIKSEVGIVCIKKEESLNKCYTGNAELFVCTFDVTGSNWLIEINLAGYRFLSEFMWDSNSFVFYKNSEATSKFLYRISKYKSYEWEVPAAVGG